MGYRIRSMLLNKELILNWIKNLKNGIYKQGKFHLRTEDFEYCCLGVAYNEHPCKNWDNVKEYNDTSYFENKKIMLDYGLFLSIITNSTNNIFISLNHYLSGINDRSNNYLNVIYELEYFFKNIDKLNEIIELAITNEKSYIIYGFDDNNLNHIESQFFEKDVDQIKESVFMLVDYDNMCTFLEIKQDE